MSVYIDSTMSGVNRTLVTADSWSAETLHRRCDNEEQLCLHTLLRTGRRNIQMSSEHSGSIVKPEPATATGVVMSTGRILFPSSQGTNTPRFGVGDRSIVVTVRSISEQYGSWMMNFRLVNRKHGQMCCSPKMCLALASRMNSRVH
jgi:hypothetical protein